MSILIATLLLSLLKADPLLLGPMKEINGATVPPNAACGVAYKLFQVVAAPLSSLKDQEWT